MEPLGEIMTALRKVVLFFFVFFYGMTATGCRTTCPLIATISTNKQFLFFFSVSIISTHTVLAETTTVTHRQHV